MSGEVVAEVQRVLRGDSERALIHAVDDDGLEYRIEVPERSVREVEDGRGYTLRLTWSLAATARLADAQGPGAGLLTDLPVQGEPASTQPPQQEQSASTPPMRRTPAEVDSAFMALMAGLQATPSTTRDGAAPEPTVTSPSSPIPAASRGAPDSAMQLASRLGLTTPQTND